MLLPSDFKMIKLVWVIPSDSVFLPFSMCPSHSPSCHPFLFWMSGTFYKEACVLGLDLLRMEAETSFL